MPDLQPNFLLILLSVLANGFFCYIWFNPLFGKTISQEPGYESTPSGPSFFRSLAMTYLGLFLMSFVLSNNIAVWQPSTWEISSQNDPGYVSQAMQASIFTWLGYFVPVSLNKKAWSSWSWKAFTIESVYHLEIRLKVVDQPLTTIS